MASQKCDVCGGVITVFGVCDRCGRSPDYLFPKFQVKVPPIKIADVSAFFDYDEAYATTAARRMKLVGQSPLSVSADSVDDTEAPEPKALPAAAGECGVSVARLCDAVAEIALYVVGQVQSSGLVGVALPRGYIVVVDQPPCYQYLDTTGSVRNSVNAPESVRMKLMRTGNMIWSDPPDPQLAGKPTVDTMAGFAADVRAGWLDELRAAFDRAGQTADDHAKLIEDALGQRWTL